MNKTCVPDLLSAALFGQRGKPDVDDWSSVYTELKDQTVLAIPADLIAQYDMPEELRREWKKQILQQMIYYHATEHIQTELLEAIRTAGIPVVILKGTSAAVYYPKPEYRAMGDIDFLVKPEHFDRACCVMEEAGCKETTSKEEEERGRHRVYRKAGVEIELHRSFATIGTDEQKACFDNYLFEDIVPERFTLSTVQNGLVLIEHIAQHMFAGIGFRQIIDWMMYVYHCLSDQMWNESFLPMAQSVGLDKLAVTATRMCQLYLGLPKEKYNWCSTANDSVCEKLMDYVMTSGNFGCKRDEISTHSIPQLPSIRKPVYFFRYLQEHGKQNWKALGKHTWLKPFAWLYQLCRNIRFLAKNRVDSRKLKMIYKEGAQRRVLFDKVGIRSYEEDSGNDHG